MKPFNTLILFILFFNSTVKTQTIQIAGPAGSGKFGTSVTVLNNGNFVVADPYFDEGPIADVGAVYLYNGLTNQLISTLKGSVQNDRVGFRITNLNNGNYVVQSQFWNNGLAASAGAFTFCNGATGINGLVGPTNSIVGSSANDLVSSNGIIVLTNGNFVVKSPNWNNGINNKAGAATWVNGISGHSGVVSSINSLVGSNTGDEVGRGVIALTNGNFVVLSNFWKNGTSTRAGAATWGNGMAGITGLVSIDNSLVGSKTGDEVGSNIIQLNNGNYVVISNKWGNGALALAGAATWGDGTTGVKGLVSISNSLIGTSANDGVGKGIIGLPNGNYVVLSPDFGSQVGTKVGAATWGNGSTGISGNVTSSNSLIGNKTGDAVGSALIVLTNGNYVVRSPNWDNGNIVNAGAATWASGTMGIKGFINSSNSLVGQHENDLVGGVGIALTNGNYVLGTSSWDNGLVPNAGAATWGNGTTGIAGFISGLNSLIGTKPNDRVAFSTIFGLTALKNGNYVVSSSDWNNGSATKAGAVTWVNGSIGLSGEVSISNSLVGTSSNDNVGDQAMFLENGNYVVTSPNWDNGAIQNVGAVTWGNGSTGLTGEVSITNSFIGTILNDQVGYDGIYPLKNGNYLVPSQFWDNGSILDAGALTFLSGSSTMAGTVNDSNSLVGNHTEDFLNAYNTIARFENGSYITTNQFWDKDGVANAGAVTLASGTMPLTGKITTCNSLLGNVQDGGLSFYPVYDIIKNRMFLGKPGENLVAIFYPTGMALATHQAKTKVRLIGSGLTPLVDNEKCELIAVINAKGNKPIEGEIKANVWLQNITPSAFNRPYLQRHYQFTSETPIDTATGRLTLFATQEEFDNFNLAVGSSLKLPVNASDEEGLQNLRIYRFRGTSINSSGTPQSYLQPAENINPDDSDIMWNQMNNRWEISFDFNNGLGGFIIASRIINTQFKFSGNGDFSNPLNWSLNGVPPIPVETTNEVQIQTTDNNECVIDVPVIIKAGAKLIINPGSRIRLPGNIIIQ